MLKGVAILFMLFYHLFNQMQNVNICNNYIYRRFAIGAYFVTGNKSSTVLSHIKWIWLIYCEEENPQYNIVNKVRNLYIHYWITLAIFVPLRALVVGRVCYPGSFAEIINNVTAWHTTWNGEIWFFFPYILLALNSKVIFKIMDNLSPLLTASTTFSGQQ